MTASLDEDAVIAATDLVGRTGARNLEVGYLNDEPPHEWYATATYKGAKVIEEGHAGPTEATEALARRLLEGARCAHCDGVVALSSAGAIVFPGAPMADGSPGWTPESAAAAPQCRWTRMGPRWVRGCEGQEQVRRPNRAERRAHKRRKRWPSVLGDGAVLRDLLADLDTCAPGDLVMAIDLRTKVEAVRLERAARWTQELATWIACAQLMVLLLALGTAVSRV